MVVGWTGSGTSLTHLESFTDVLRPLLAARSVELRVISSRRPELGGLPVTFREWSPASEVEEVRAFDIGIKPQPDDAWSRGKCAMKELQYMALGIPAVCSPVGGSRESIRHGENGFLAATADEWLESLLRLVDDAPLRERVGRAGRRTVEQRYSAHASASAFADALRTGPGAALTENEAVAQHSKEAADFAASYAQLDRDPYASCFAYSRRRLELLLARVLPARGDGLRLLDLGCGTGHHLAQLRAARLRRGRHRRLGRHAGRRRMRSTRAPGSRSRDGERLPFADGAFDARALRRGAALPARHGPDPAPRSRAC